MDEDQLKQALTDEAFYKRYVLLTLSVIEKNINDLKNQLKQMNDDITSIKNDVEEIASK